MNDTLNWKEIEQCIGAAAGRRQQLAQRLTAAGTGQKGGRTPLACGKPAFLRCFCGQS